MRVNSAAFRVNQPELIISHFHFAALRWIALRDDANYTLFEGPVFFLGRVGRHLKHVRAIRRESNRIGATALPRRTVQLLVHQRTVDLLVI